MGLHFSPNNDQFNNRQTHAFTGTRVKECQHQNNNWRKRRDDRGIVTDREVSNQNNRANFVASFDEGMNERDDNYDDSLSPQEKALPDQTSENDNAAYEA